MTQNRTLAALTDTAITGKNYIANGDFRLWSRGTSFTNGTPGQFGGPDGVFVVGSNNQFTISRQTFTPGTAPVSGYEGAYFMRFASTTGNVDPRFYVTIPGDVRVLAGKAVTLSFWAKSDVASIHTSSGSRGIRWEQGFGTGGSASGTGTLNYPTYTSSWTRYTFTGTIASIAGATIGTDNSLQLAFKFVASTAFNFDIWGLQLEVGSTATAFVPAGGNNQLDTVVQGSPGYDGVLVSTSPYWSAGSSSIPSTGWAGYVVAGKNACINGGFDIWQRGTTSSIAASGYGADRWYYGVNSAVPSGTVSAQAFAPGNAITGYEPQYYKRWNITSHNNCTNLQFENHLEDVRTFAGQTVTLSYWAKADASSDINVFIQQAFQSGTVNALSTTHTITSSWTRYTHTLTMPSLSGATIGTSSYVNILIKLPRGATYLRPGTYDFWGFQLELGSVATPFSRAGGTIQGELTACERYCQAFVPTTVYSYYGIGGYNSTTLCYIGLKTKTTMRTQPTATYTAANTFLSNQNGQKAVSAVATDQLSPDMAGIVFTTATATAGGAAIVQSNNTLNSRILLEAEI